MRNRIQQKMACKGQTDPEHRILRREASDCGANYCMRRKRQRPIPYSFRVNHLGHDVD